MIFACPKGDQFDPSLIRSRPGLAKRSMDPRSMDRGPQAHMLKGFVITPSFSLKADR